MSRIRLVTGVIIVCVLSALSLYRVPTTFNISARTQVVDVVVGLTHRDVWFLNDSLIFRGFEGGKGEPFGGTLRVLPRTVVNVTRIGGGPLRLTCSAHDSESPVVELQASGRTSQTVRGRLVIVVPHPNTNADREEQPTVLPINGAITIGAEVTDAASEYPVLLLDGSVTMLAHTILGKLRYDAGRVALDLGDFIKLDTAADGYGLLVIGPGGDLSAVFRVVARSLSVYRFGAEGYSFYASPFTRIQKDPAIQAVWAATLLLFALWAKLEVRGKQGREHATP